MAVAWGTVRVTLRKLLVNHSQVGTVYSQLLSGTTRGS